MSYGSRSMTSKDDLLFRVATRIPAYDYDKPIYGKNENGRTIVVGTEPARTEDWVGYTGPYASLGVARGARTKEIKDQARYNGGRENRVVTVELEACMPDWKVME